MAIFITGVAGFIGFHLANTLLAQGHSVVGLDNLNPYYDVRYKQQRLAVLETQSNFSWHQGDVADTPLLQRILQQHNPTLVLHMAAQAGVRYSLTHPQSYVHANVVAMCNLLQLCAAMPKVHVVYASSSSVYGLNTPQPASIDAVADTPASFYAATKRAGELFAHAYAHTHGLACTGLRFFTVYGPYGRPDMAVHKFADAIANNRPIDIYNHGQMSRDMTYIDDAVAGILAAAALPHRTATPHRVYNIGSGTAVPLNTLVQLLETAMGRTAIKNLLPMQTGDVHSSLADLTCSVRDFGYSPKVDIAEGIARTIAATPAWRA